MTVTIDFETKSYADLKKVGAWAYSKHPTTDVICVCYGIDDREIQEWWPGKDCATTHGMPVDLYTAMLTGHTIEAHNVAFEWSVWHNVLAVKYGWMTPYAHQMRDTMAAAAYYSLPRALDKLAQVLGFPGKDPEGGRLITKYSKLHLKTAKAKIPEEDFRKFVEYCKQDVRIEQAVSDFLGDLPPREIPVFLMDQEINRRGLLLDEAGIEVASKIVDQRAEELAARFRKITGVNPTQRDRAIEWFEAQGLELENMQADYLEELLEEGSVPAGPAREALTIRLKINKASTKKLDSMARNACPEDGRARFQSVYHGANTGRWTGTGFQPLNLNRGFDEMDPEQLVSDIMHGDAEYLDMIYGDAMDAVGKASRHWIKAAEGSKIMAGDFVSVEAVILACGAGEQWKVDAFREGKRIYELMGDKIYGYPEGTVTKKTHPMERQDGKTGELAFGYQGALGAWRKFDSSDRHSDERVIEICKAWRAEHPMIVKFWHELERCAINAVMGRGSTCYRSVEFEMVDEWLTMILPDGKRLWYWKPEVRMGMPAWHKPREYEDCAEGTCECKPVPKLSYMSQKEGQWRRVYTYGGKLVENWTQATSRQVLVPAMLALADAWNPRLRDMGYLKHDESCIILSVYDEVVVEVPEDFATLDEFRELLMVRPDFAKDWPIRVDAWEGSRYKK